MFLECECFKRIWIDIYVFFKLKKEKLLRVDSFFFIILNFCNIKKVIKEEVLIFLIFIWWIVWFYRNKIIIDGIMFNDYMVLNLMK